MSAEEQLRQVLLKEGKRGVGVRSFEKKALVSRSAINRFVNGKNDMRISCFERLAKATGRRLVLVRELEISELSAGRSVFVFESDTIAGGKLAGILIAGD